MIKSWNGPLITERKMDGQRPRIAYPDTTKASEVRYCVLDVALGPVWMTLEVSGLWTDEAKWSQLVNVCMN